MRAYFVAPDKRDARDVFMMRVVTRILDHVQYWDEWTEGIYATGVYFIMQEFILFFFGLVIMIRNLLYH